MSKIWGNFVGINFRVPLHSGHCYFQKAVIFKGCYLREAATFHGATVGEPLLLGGHYFPGALLSGRLPLPRGCYIREAATFQETAAFGGPLLSRGPLFLMFYSNR